MSHRHTMVLPIPRVVTGTVHAKDLSRDMLDLLLHTKATAHHRTGPHLQTNREATTAATLTNVGSQVLTGHLHNQRSRGGTPSSHFSSSSISEDREGHHLRPSQIDSHPMGLTEYTPHLLLRNLNLRGAILSTTSTSMNSVLLPQRRSAKLPQDLIGRDTGHLSQLSILTRTAMTTNSR